MPMFSVVVNEIEQMFVRLPKRISYTCGHDICEVISKGIHDVFGRAHVSLQRSGVAVEEVFRAAFSRENFSATNIFADIRGWEQKHRPFRILPV